MGPFDGIRIQLAQDMLAGVFQVFFDGKAGLDRIGLAYVIRFQH